MEILSVENLSFQYGENNILQDVSLSVSEGEMVLLCGPCGCGKTTFLRLLKEEIRPNGTRSGEIRCLYPKEAIGYLFQNPESQIVCRTVEEELAFGAENLGMARGQIARAIAEISAYLGIEDWLEQETAKLSGGQKQILNLAALLIMKPKILLLDEPLSQLDPVSTCDFLQLLRKIREDLNISILLAEHNLDVLLKDVDRVCYIEQGKIEFQGNVQMFLQRILKEDCRFHHSMPALLKWCKKYHPELRELDVLPLTVREYLGEKKLKHRFEMSGHAKENAIGGEEILGIKGGYFRYEKHGKDILRNVNLSLKKGQIYGLIGGNGVGKSTLCSVMSGYRKLYRGKYRCDKKVAVLPQNPMYAFVQDNVGEDMQMVASKEKIEMVLHEYEFCRNIGNWMDVNPLDLSGGQMQKAAIFKMLLTDGEVLLMDEPVKSMDGYEKMLFAKVLEELKAKGKTILLISHDLEFVEAVVDRCLFLFHGEILIEAEPEEMFRNNRFYTTVRGRLET